jgi:hypothetical protein
MVDLLACNGCGCTVVDRRDLVDAHIRSHGIKDLDEGRKLFSNLN